MNKLQTVFDLMALSGTFTASAEQPPDDLFLQWSLSIGTSGEIESLVSLSKDQRPLAEQLEPTIRRWHFAPGNVDGHRAETETTLTVRVTFETAGGNNYRAHVASAMTGARYLNGPAPAYPPSAMRMGRYGEVNIQVDHDANGHVLSAKVMAPSNPHVDSILTRAALDAVKKWTFQPERVGGHGVAGSAIASTCFSLVGHDDPCFWTTPRGERERVDSTRPFPISSVVSLSVGDAMRAP